MARPRLELDVEWMQHLAALGLTRAQICTVMGISVDTLLRRRKENPVFAAILDKAGLDTVVAVANALLKSALDGDVRAQMFFLRSRAGWAAGRLAAETKVGSGETSREEILRKILRLSNGSAGKDVTRCGSGEKDFSLPDVTVSEGSNA